MWNRSGIVMREEPEGVLINAQTQQPFTYKDSCVELDPHTSYHTAATAAAITSVREFLKTVFKF